MVYSEARLASVGSSIEYDRNDPDDVGRKMATKNRYKYGHLHPSPSSGLAV